MARWLLKQSSTDTAELARQTGVNPVLARIFAVRGLRTAAQIQLFLHPEQSAPASPFLFADMDKATEIAAAAIAQGKKCAVFGDYDADGIMSTLILLNTLRSLGGNALYYIPQREGEGYGMNNEAVRSLAADGVEVIFACDNGISAFEQVELANSLGLTVVILDHHAVTMEPGADGKLRQVLPPAQAVVDSKRVDCAYPFPHYCAAGVCYRFSEALYARMERDWRQLGDYLLPFAAIATVCDLVELSGENRDLVKRGLPRINSSGNPGLRGLIRAVNLQDKTIDTYHVGFILGPCINASGRLDIADTAVELFLTADVERADYLANQLTELNQERRRLTEEGATLCCRMIEEAGFDQDKVIVIHCRDAQESVAGIIAGRVKERYYRPAVVLVGRGEQVRGSCRSIDSYNIYDGLFSCRDLLAAFGGHPMAAGLSIRAEDVPQLRQRLNDHCQLGEDELQPTFRVDCPLSPAYANLDLALALEALAPYGKGNSRPLFAACGLQLSRITLLGKGQVMRWQLRLPTGATCEAINFSARDRLQNLLSDSYGPTAWEQLLQGRCTEQVLLDVIYQLEVNHYNGRDSAQLQIIDFRPAVS